MAEVIPFPEGGRPSNRKVLRLLKEAVEDSDKLIYLKRYSENEEWYRLVTNRQVTRCLQDGKMRGSASLDSEGNWRCLLYRLCGGVWVHVEVALHLNEDQSLNCVYVLNVDNRTPT